MKKRYFHNHRPDEFQDVLNQMYGMDHERHTVVVEIPSFFKVMKLLTGSLSISKPSIALKVGYSRCHPLDQYNKKEGIKIAEQRTKPVWFDLNQVIMDENDIRFFMSGVLMEPYSNDMKVLIEFKMYKDSKKIRVMTATIEKQTNKDWYNEEE